MLSVHVRADAQARALGSAAALESACALLAPLCFGPVLRLLQRVRAEALSYVGAAALFATMLPVLWVHGRAARARAAAQRLRESFPEQLAEPLVSAAANRGDDSAEPVQGEEGETACWLGSDDEMYRRAGRAQ